LGARREATARTHRPCRSFKAVLNSSSHSIKLATVLFSAYHSLGEHFARFRNSENVRYPRLLNCANLQISTRSDERKIRVGSEHPTLTLDRCEVDIIAR
jgi:hypothetical protein